MENLYEIVPIEGKGQGCVALQEIKIGTLILKERPQCVAKQELVSGEGGHLSYDYLKSLSDAFFAMSSSDQQEFMKLESRFKDKNLLEDLALRPERGGDYLKKMLSELEKFVETTSSSIEFPMSPQEFFGKETPVEKLDELFKEMLLEILCVYESNTFKECYINYSKRNLANRQIRSIREGGVGLKFSKFNHSCQPNAEAHLNQAGEIELRAVSKIKVCF